MSCYFLTANYSIFAVQYEYSIGHCIKEDAVWDTVWKKIIFLDHVLIANFLSLNYPDKIK